MTTATLTPIVGLSVHALFWEDLPALAERFPDAVADRVFMYMKPGEGLPEMITPALHIESKGFLVVIPIVRLTCEVRCDICCRPRHEYLRREDHADLGELCPVCRGTKRRTHTVGDVQKFVDAGDRYSMSGTHWRVAPLRLEV